MRVFSFLLGLRTAPLLQVAYDHVLADLDRCFQILLSSSQSQQQLTTAAAAAAAMPPLIPSSSTVIGSHAYNVRDSVTAFVFSCLALGFLGETWADSSFVSVRVLKPSLVEVLIGE